MVAAPVPPLLADRGVALRLPALLVSLGAIALAALAIAALAASLILLALLAHEGREELSDLMMQARFDPVMRLQVGAGEISLLYVGLGAATLGAARIVGGRDWRRLVALAQARLRWGKIVGICLGTLLYAAALTLALLRLQTQRVATDGPTNLLLLAGLIGNVVVLAPLAEELFFRGWLYTGLRERLGFGPSFALTTLAFAAMHWDANHRRILLVMPLAVALGILREA